MKTEQEIRDRLSALKGQRETAACFGSHRAVAELLTAETILRWTLDEPVADDIGQWECAHCGDEAKAHATGGRRESCLWQPRWEGEVPDAINR